MRWENEYSISRDLACKVCGKIIRGLHKVKGKKRCEACKKLSEDEVKIKRKRHKPKKSSVRTISGGLPSLGKHHK